MLTILRVASRARAASLIPVICRPFAPKLLAAPCLQQQVFCSDRPPRRKTKVCSGGPTKDKPKDKSKDKDEETDEDKPKKKLDDCCNKKDSKDVGKKGKGVICDESQTKFIKETATKEEESESSSSCSDKEEVESSEDEEAKSATKECEDEELSEHSDDEEKQSKAATEMCDCVKAAVAKAVDNKGKEGGRPKTEASLDKPGPCTSPKGKEAEAKPKVSEHVRCCNVERSKSASQGGKSGVEKCKSFRKDKSSGKDKDKPSGGKGDDNVDKINDPCECIKKALEKCKQPGKPEPKPDAKKPDSKKPDEKKPDPKKPSPKKPDEKKPGPKKPDEKKPGPKKPDPKEPDSKKPGSKGKKDCKKKKPVVKCK